MLAAMATLGFVQARAEHERLLELAHGLARHTLADVDAAVAERLTLLDGVAATIAALDADVALESVIAVSGATGLALALHDESGSSIGPRDDRRCQAPTSLDPRMPRRVTGLRRCPDETEPFVLAVAPAGAGRTLSVRWPAGLLREPLIRPGVLADSGAALADAEGIVLARWQDHERFVGHPIPEHARRALLSPDPTWRGRNLAGERVLVVHVTSPLTGWSLGYGLRRSRLSAPGWDAMWTFAPIAAALTLLAAGATFLLARRIERPIAGLADAALALGRGEAPRLPRTAIAEVETVAAALDAAAAAQRDTEARRRLMVLEMQHRVKNMLSTVQSIAALSARGATDPGEFARAFGQRLRAMADTHALLMSDGGAAAPLDALLARELAPYARDPSPRVEYAGPAVLLPADAAIALVLVIHELATNAAKHGALSGDKGRVRIAWRMIEAGPARRLELDWEETGGPPVTGPPERQGFGSRLLRQVLGGRLQGQTTLEWRQAGLVARIELPLGP